MAIDLRNGFHAAALERSLLTKAAMKGGSSQPLTGRDLPPDDWQRAAALWERILGRVPSLLGKLVSIASFRDGPDSYWQPKLDRVFPPGVASQVLRESHEQLFAQWLGLFFDEQYAELRAYLASLPQGDGRKLLADAQQALIPVSASETARQVFLADFEAILAVPEDPGLAASAHTA